MTDKHEERFFMSNNVGSLDSVSAQFIIDLEMENHGCPLYGALHFNDGSTTAYFGFNVRNKKSLEETLSKLEKLSILIDSAQRFVNKNSYRLNEYFDKYDKEVDCD